jgi:hypothetical protein
MNLPVNVSDAVAGDLLVETYRRGSKSTPVVVTRRTKASIWVRSCNEGRSARRFTGKGAWWRSYGTPDYNTTHLAPASEADDVTWNDLVRAHIAAEEKRKRDIAQAVIDLRAACARAESAGYLPEKDWLVISLAKTMGEAFPAEVTQ